MSTWDEIKDSPAGTEFTDNDGDRWRFTETEVLSLENKGFGSQNRKDNADLFFGEDYYGPYLVTESLELVDPQTTEPTRVWSEHLADITRAVQIISDADKALKDAAPHGTPGYYSDLDFQFPRRVPITIGGVDTSWAIVWDDDSEAWMAEFGA